MKKTFLALFALLAVTTAAFPLYEGNPNDIMIQGFHWESHMIAWWSNMQAKADAITNAGISLVWYPPCTKAASDEGYLATEWYNLNSFYGTSNALKSSIAAMHSRGVKVLADLVINHRCGSTGWADFSNPAFADNKRAVCVNDEWGQGTGAYDTGDPIDAARDLDHTYVSVQDEIKKWLMWMKTNIGYDGWRIDMPRGFSASYCGMYNDYTLPNISVGEYWDGDRQKLCDWVNGTGGKASVFDFSTKYILQDAVANSAYYKLKDAQSKAAGLIGWWPAVSVTFVDNHDTGPSTGGAGGQNKAPFPADKIMQGYAYILTHPGIPCIYWPHYFDWGTATQSEIKKLVGIRKQAGVNRDSSLVIMQADSSVYAAIIGGSLAMKIGAGTWSPGIGWTLAASGLNYSVWTKSGVPNQIRTVIFMQKETVTGQDIFVKGGHDAGLVPTYFPAMSEPIVYNNTKNTTTAAIKAADASLDWGSESALDWTCNTWPAAWGAKKVYSADGYGEDPENTFGLHWWKLDVNMYGARGDWFEFKAFMRQGTTEWWENNIVQAGTPNATINHWGKKGYIAKCAYGQNWVEFIPLP